MKMSSLLGYSLLNATKRTHTDFVKNKCSVNIPVYTAIFR